MRRPSEATSEGLLALSAFWMCFMSIKRIGSLGSTATYCSFWPFWGHQASADLGSAHGVIAALSSWGFKSPRRRS